MGFYRTYRVIDGPHEGSLLTLPEGNGIIIEDEHGYNEYIARPGRDILIWNRGNAKPAGATAKRVKVGVPTTPVPPSRA